jgi:P-type Ca2+ transporter type 2C
MHPDFSAGAVGEGVRGGGSGFTLQLVVVSVPFLQPMFNTHFPNLREWSVILSFALVPAVAEEITKVYLRRRDGRKRG